MTVFLDKSLLENHGVASDVHFEDQSCNGYDYSSQYVAVTTRYNDCDTQSEQTDAVIKYSNVVTYFKPTGENGSLITRDFRLKIPVTCELNRRSLLGSSFKPKLGVVKFTEIGYGNFSLSLSRFSDDSFSAPSSDLEALVLLGEKLYFAVNLTAVTDITLMTDRCWATPDVYPMNPTAYTFIKDGCAEDSTVDFYNSMGALFKGFSIEAFAFIGEYPEVYLHCDILVCDNTDPNSRCAQGCVHRSRRSASGSRGTSSKPHTISNGPLSNQQDMESRDRDSSWLSQPVNMMLVGTAGFFIAMVAMVSVRKWRGRRQGPVGYRPLKTEEA
ncbi:oncoprotein-induced transcript 3 protein-like [Diadema setosum]|uniref:oncoprotein-induced transcript 3 protein-like n=1 Tax=Diadema setosum TaxID=31175 RepID=UPI003B3B00B1